MCTLFTAVARNEGRQDDSKEDNSIGYSVFTQLYAVSQELLDNIDSSPRN